MKQYTAQEQTAKLIELGFEKPKSIEVYRDGHCVPFVEQRWAYSIGELIELLPIIIDVRLWLCIKFYHNRGEWEISYDDNGLYSPLYSTENDEFIDALYDMVVKLKEEGVI